MINLVMMWAIDWVAIFFPYPLTIFIIMHASPSLHHTKVVSFFLTIKLKPQEEKKSTIIKHQSS